MKTLIPSLVLVVALMSATTARSTELEKTPQEIENLAKELVIKLGDDEFMQRVAASQELEKLGIGALRAVKEGLDNPDPEIRARCKRLYPKIRLLDLERRIELLATDKDGRIANTLPLAATYLKICGKDENARKFYFELCKDNLQLLDDIANKSKMTGLAFIDFINEIDKRDKDAFSPLTEGAALLLIAADEKIGPSIDEANRKQTKGGDRNYQRLIGILWQPKYEALMLDPNNGRYFRKLLFAWAKRLPEPLAMQSFLFFLRDMIKKQVMNLQSDSDTLEFLMDFVVSTTSKRMSYQRGEAMSMVAASAIPKNDLIAYFEEKLLKDETTLLPAISFDLKGPTKITVETRACDYALAVCVKLSGQSFAEYGFDILGSQSDMFKSWVCAGFAKDETRKAAFKKYAEWRKANPIKKDEPKKD
jgi:hypothetical protein